jgi:N-acetylmuramoyl-L-alanine amidase
MLSSRIFRWAPWLLVAASACARTTSPVPLSQQIRRTAHDQLVTTSPSSAVVPSRVDDSIALHVIYPAADDLVRVQDSSFLFGSVASKHVRITINGSPVKVWPNGAWLAWLPFPPDSVMQFRIEARLPADSVVLIYPVRRDPHYVPREIRVGTAWIDSTSLSPQGQVWLPSSEYLTLSTRAAEGSDVSVRLADGRVIRLQPEMQSGEVLPALRAFDRDTSKLRGADEVRYVGIVRGRTIGPDPGPVVGTSLGTIGMLGRAVSRCAAGLACPAPYAELASSQRDWAIVQAVHSGDTVRVRWPLQVAILDTVPVVTEFDDDTLGRGNTDSISPGRATPGGTYEWFFPTGTRAAVSGRWNSDLRIRLSPVAEAWVNVADARPLPRGLPEPHAVVSSVTLSSTASMAVLRIPLSQRVPFQISETERTVGLKFYGAVGDVDWMRYGSDSLVDRMSWAQSGREEMTLTVELTSPLWGYRARWSRNDLLLEIRRPPLIDHRNPLRGRLIALDPGHPPLGATGPTGLREAEANLAVAFQLRAMLEKSGARVLMTRTVDSAIDLWPRVALADTAGADVLVSIHNNALPDGVNPFTNNGTSVFYNQPRSIPLALEVQRALVRRLKLPDLGISRADLALVRSTWMPSILCEGMFMLIPEQELMLRSSEGQRRYARGVYEGIRSFLEVAGKAQRAGSVGQRSSGASPKTHPTSSPRAPTPGASAGGVSP